MEPDLKHSVLTAESILRDVDTIMGIVALFTVSECGQIVELSGNGYARASIDKGRAIFPQALADWPQVTHFSCGTTEEEIAANIIEIYPHCRRWHLSGKSVVVAPYPKSSNVDNDHQHSWHRTGEYHPTANPIYFYHCTCGALGKAQEGESIRLSGIDPNYRQCEPCESTKC